SNTLFGNPDVKFVNINVAEIDALKESATALVGDARETLTDLLEALGGWSVSDEIRQAAVTHATEWRAEIDRIIELDDGATLS
ncbi:3D-(3,5/4)-trihydroxycyclohexane-1,2-dione acylhydrolase (decyclizing), partial [Rhizobium johnstonii]